MSDYSPGYYLVVDDGSRHFIHRDARKIVWEGLLEKALEKHKVNGGWWIDYLMGKATDRYGQTMLAWANIDQLESLERVAFNLGFDSF